MRTESTACRHSKIANVKLIGLAAILSAAIATLSVGAFGHPAFHSDMDRIHRLEHFHCDVRHWVGLV
jgi:hypothetical protein